MDATTTAAGTIQAIRDTQAAADLVQQVSNQIADLQTQAQIADMNKDSAAIPGLVKQATQLKRQLVAAHANYVKQTYIAQIVTAINLATQQGNTEVANKLTEALKKFGGRSIQLRIPDANSGVVAAPPATAAGKLNGIFDFLGDAVSAVGGAIGDAASWMGDNAGAIGQVAGGVVSAATGTDAGKMIGGMLGAAGTVVQSAVNPPKAATSSSPVPTNLPAAVTATQGVSAGYTIPAVGTVPTTGVASWFDQNKWLVIGGGGAVALGITALAVLK